MVYSGFDTLMPLIRPDVPQCPDVTIEQYMVRVVRDFCEQSRVWQEWTTEVIGPGIETYPLSVGTGEVVAVKKVQHSDGRKLQPIDYTLPGEEEGNMAALSGVVGFTFDPPDTLHIQGSPTQSEEVFVQLSLKPTLEQAQAPQWLIQKYEDALVNGVLARLKMIANKPWSNPDYAMAHKDMFLRGIASARIHELKKHTNASLSIKARPFGG